MYKKVIKNTTVLSIGTLLSRILGFIRDILQANFFGTSAILEAFLVAFRLPNIFRSIFAEGFSDSVATPTLSEHSQDKEKVFAIGNNLISFFAVILCVFTILGIIFSKFLVMMIAPGFTVTPDKFVMAVSFTRITFVYLLLISLASIFTSMLYSLKRFIVPALNPVFLNIVFIVGILLFNKFFYTLAICVLIGGLIETIFPFLSLKSCGFYINFNFNRAIKDKTIRDMLRLFFPRIWSGIIYQLNVFIDTIFSSLTLIVGQGAIAAVYYANRLIQFPFALVALSLAPVVVVDLSSFNKQENINDFKNLVVFSLQTIAFLIIPFTFILIFIPDAIIDVLFRRGKFDLASLNITATVLFYYSFSLFFACASKLLITSFYALKDTTTPAKAATVGLIANVVLNSLLMFPLGIGGIALATSIASVINFIYLYSLLVKKIGKIDWADTRKEISKIVLVSIFLGVISRLIFINANYNKYIQMFTIIGIDLIAFFILGMLLKIKQLAYIKKKMMAYVRR